MPRQAEDLPRAERGETRLGLVSIAVTGHDHGVGARDRVDRLAQPAAGERPRVGDVARVDQHEVRVAREHHMLKPVVEQVDRGAEHALGEHAGEVPIGRDEERHAARS